MLRAITGIFLLVLGSASYASCPGYLEHSMRKLHSSDQVNLCEIQSGKPMLVINTASHCGYTRQFKGLEALHEKYGERGLVVVGFALLMARMLQVANRARSDFDSLVVVGVATMLMFQVVVNIFMTIGLGPVTGIPLPFMSYGRSAMVVNFIALGLCLSVARRERQGLSR